MIKRTVFLLIFISIVCAQRQTVQNVKPKCAYTFLTESAVCGNTNYLREVALEFRPTWKHIKVVSSTGIFSMAGIHRNILCTFQRFGEMA